MTNPSKLWRLKHTHKTKRKAYSFFSLLTSALSISQRNMGIMMSPIRCMHLTAPLNCSRPSYQTHHIPKQTLTSLQLQVAGEHLTPTREMTRKQTHRVARSFGTNHMLTLAEIALDRAISLCIQLDGDYLDRTRGQVYKLLMSYTLASNSHRPCGTCAFRVFGVCISHV